MEKDAILFRAPLRSSSARSCTQHTKRTSVRGCGERKGHNKTERILFHVHLELHSWNKGKRSVQIYCLYGRTTRTRKRSLSRALLVDIPKIIERKQNKSERTLIIARARISIVRFALCVCTL